MDSFFLKFMINAMTLTLIKSLFIYFCFDIVIFPFLGGDVPRRASYGVYGVYISQLIRFARVCNHVADFNAQQPNFFSNAIGIINFAKPFLNFIADTMNSFPNLMLG